MAQLNLHLFGAPRMLLNASLVEVDTRKATALMAYLVVEGGAHQRDSLALLLWPDYDQTSARAALRRTLSTLNRALEVDGGSPFLNISRDNVSATPENGIWSDVAAFRELAAGAARHGHPPGAVCQACLAGLLDAARLYRAPFLAGFNLRDSPTFEEWQFFQEETLRRELAAVLERAVGGLEAAGRAEEAVQYARRWLSLDPLLEEPHRQLMLLYARADQRSAALRQYRECVRVLDQELGVEPLDETTALYHQILNRAPLPERQVRLVEVIPAPVLGEGRAVDSPASPGQPAQDPGAPIPPLIGRDGELRDLMEAWKSLREDGLLLALEGEAGIGKSRLAAEFLDAVQARGARVIQARCYSGESGLAYAPFVQAFSAALAQPEAAARLQALPPGVLAEVGRLLPDAALRPAMPATPAAGGPASMGAPVTSGAGEIVPAGAVRLTDTGASAQARFFEALRHALQALLEGQTPGVLFLDDVHWIDSASRSLLIYLAHRLHGLPVLVLTAWRDEENESTRVLVELVEDQARRLGQDGARIHLKRFGHADIAELVRASAGREVTAALADRLYSESEGLPYAAVQYLAALTGQADPERWEMPAGLRALLRSRVTGLDAAAQQILGAAAVIGRSFDFDILRDASGRSDVEIVDGLERLLKAGLVVEGSGLDVRYDFTHEKLRALIYEETSLARRRLLHRRAAEAYARSAAGMAENAGLVAYHYEQAGLGPAAAEYHRAAGERALRLFANVEAMAHFQAALAEGHPDAAWLHEAIGDLYLLRGAYPTARASYEKAASLCTPGCVSNLEHKLGNVHHRMGAWKLADSHYLASLEAAGPPDAGSAFHVHLYTDRSMVALALGEAERGQDLAERALELAQASGDPGALAQAFNALGVLARARGNMRAAIQALEASLRTADSLEDPLARIAALNNLALVHGETGSLQRALELTRLALDLCRRRGDRHRQAALHNNLADLLHREGREEEAMEQLKQAVVIFTEIGQAAENAAVWNLTEW